MAAMVAGPSVAELSTDVGSTVEQLRELGQLSRQGGVGDEPSSGGLSHVDEVVAALRELDDKRQKAHELLETETITASVLRHRLANFPLKLKAEVTAALQSARQANCTHVQSLQARLTELTDQTEHAGRRKEVLQLHNQVLESELVKIKGQHEELMVRANASMSKKASMQITLNETEDKLRTTNSKIDSLERGMVRLQEAMEARREEFEAEKLSLVSLLEDTRSKCTKQTEENARRETELAELEEEGEEARLQAEEQGERLRETEASIARLLGLEEELRTALKHGGTRTVQLEKAGVDTIAETERLRGEFATRKKETLEKTKLYKREVELQATETKGLSDTERSLRRDMRKAQDATDMQSHSVSDMQESVSQSKKTLHFQADESARLEAESRELEFRVAQLLETHQVTVQLYREQVADLTEKLSREQNTRQEVQEGYSDLQRQIRSQKEGHRKAMDALTTKITEGQKQQSTMSDKAIELQSGIEEQKQTITSLSQQLRGVRAKLHAVRTSQGQRIADLEESITDLTEELAERDATQRENEPVCAALETDTEEKSTVYEEKKKALIALKNQRAALEEEAQRIKQQLEKMHLPQEKLRMDTLRCRAYTRQCLRRQKLEVAAMEQQVLDANQQLTAVNRENQRIEQMCRELERESSRLRMLCESAAETKSQLCAELGQCRDALAQEWLENEKLEETNSARDAVVLGDISRLREASEERLQVVIDLHGHFARELQDFSTFIHTAATVQTKGW